MTDFTVLPAEIDLAIDRMVKRNSPKGDAVDQLLARVEILGALEKNIQAAQQEVIEHLQAKGGKPNWAAVASRLGIGYSAAWNRFSMSGTTRDERKAKSAAAQPKATPDGLEGVTITEAHEQTGIARDTITAYINKDPSGTWYVKTPALRGARGTVTRIVDLDALKELRANSRKSRS